MLKNLTAIVLTLISLCSFAQDKSAIIAQIKADYKELNEYKGYKVIEIDQPFNEPTDGGAALTGYFRGDTLCKINYFLGLSFGAQNFTYYLKGGGVFFVFDTEDVFPITKDGSSLDQSKTVRDFEGRYYISNGKVIHKITKGKYRYDGNQFSGYRSSLFAQYRRMLIKKFKQTVGRR